jgi:hypothetical protein
MAEASMGRLAWEVAAVSSSMMGVRQSTTVPKTSKTRAWMGGVSGGMGGAPGASGRAVGGEDTPEWGWLELCGVSSDGGAGRGRGLRSAR